MLSVELWNEISNDEDIKLAYEMALGKATSSKYHIYSQKFRKEVKKGLRSELFHVISEESEQWVNETLKKNPKAFGNDKKEKVCKIVKWNRFFNFIIEQIAMEIG